MGQTTPTSAKSSLAVELGGLRLQNPMMTASGTCGYAFEYEGLMDLSRLGAFVTKSITLEARKGNEPQRIIETRAGMLNAIGLANIGLDMFVEEKLPQLARLRSSGPRIIVNVAGHCVEDYVRVAGTLAPHDVVDGIELNVSCPNTSDGLVFGTDPTLLKKLVREVCDAMAGRARLIVKLSPNAADIIATARAAIEGGAEILSLINTYTAMAIDIQKRQPSLANVTGGLSGPAVRPLAVYLTQRVYREVARNTGVPLIGMGGIQCWQDAAEFVLAGATGLAVGTALFVDPEVPNTILDGLSEYIQEQGCGSIAELVGSVQLPGDPPVSPYP